jgi:Ion transport protein
MDSPVEDPESTMKRSLFWIDVATTIVFIMEAVMKNVAFGFLFNGKWSYMRQNWNVVDFLIIIFSLLSLTPLSDNLKTFKIFRVLRLLRLITRNEELKVAVRALFLAIPNVANVTIIMILFFLIFGIIAVSYFKGKFYYCVPAVEEELIPLTVRSKWQCIDTGGEWMNSVYNFDNVSNALITLFVMSTIAGWADIMMLCAKSTDIDYLQDNDISPVWIFFFILFIIVGAFFFLNLFVGVVISTFNSEHEKLGGNDLLTEKQKEWIELRLLVLRSAPERKLSAPENKYRRYFYNVANNKHFDRFIYICILLNTFILLFKWYEQPIFMDRIAEWLNYGFTAIFLFEAVFKIVGIGYKEYFEDGWHIFDTIIIMGSFISIFISANTSLEIRGALSILRSFRILRLLRLIKRGKSL